MTMTLLRSSPAADGLFGLLKDDQLSFASLERTYPYINRSKAVPTTEYRSKIPAGSYLCVRGIHQLKHKPHPFETFEILEIPGHWGVLFHPANYGFELDGCIALGESIIPSLIQPQERMLAKSKQAFQNFMKSQDGIQSFILNIQNEG